MIDYECLANNIEGNDLTEYKLGGIEEGENDRLLKKSNLNTLTEGKKMEDFIKNESAFTMDNLDKYVIIKLDEIKSPKAINYLFDFELEGILNKKINNGEKNIELELNEIEDKVNCKFTVEDDTQANLNCKLDINKYKDINLFSFNTSEITTENNDIFLPKLDEILLLNEIEEEDKNNNNKWIIIGCVIEGVILIGIVVGIAIYLFKRVKKTNINNHTENNNIKENDGSGNIKVSLFGTILNLLRKQLNKI